MASFATAASVCALLPATALHAYVPGATPQPLATEESDYCQAGSGVTTASFRNLGITLTPTAHLDTFQSWFESETQGVPEPTVRQLPQLSNQAVSIYRVQSNGVTVSEVLWRQDHYQLELQFAAVGPDRRAGLIDVATSIYANHPH